MAASAFQRCCGPGWQQAELARSLQPAQVFAEMLNAMQSGH
jgi:hypothetical protein